MEEEDLLLGLFPRVGHTGTSCNMKQNEHARLRNVDQNKENTCRGIYDAKSQIEKNTLLSNYSSTKGVLYCKPHFEQLFKETDFEQLFKKNGNFSKN
ncbi:hypothetical protein Sjap_010707 [Stephania japonica]|uniref:Uncharacterized protein n=1 Tax=Stephania japonica TaxID=461633 RepID=A0AAP0JAY6_9MAGN